MLINTSGMRQLNALCWIFHHIGLKMDGVIVVYYDGDVEIVIISRLILILGLQILLIVGIPKLNY